MPRYRGVSLCPRPDEVLGKGPRKMYTDTLGCGPAGEWGFSLGKRIFSNFVVFCMLI